MRPLGVEIAAMLAARGVTTVFGIPGVHNIELYRGIEESGLRHVLARNEMGAGFMADGFARASGMPGVCFVISGPGLTNIMTPMGQAYSDSVPMLVISTVLDETAARRGQLHQMRDQEGAARAVCDWSETATSAEAAYALIERAFSEFETERPRPKHIQVPVSVLGAPAPPPPAKRPEIAGTLVAGPTDVARVAQALKAAKRPLFIFGGGARRAPWAATQSVLAHSGAASFVTYAGRGIVDAANPLFFGSFLAQPGSADEIARADCVVAVGTALAEVDLWRDDLGATVPVVRVDRDPEVLADRHRTGLRIASDAERFMRALNVEMLKHRPDTQWDPGEIANARRTWRRALEAARPGIVAVCDALRAALPDKTHIYSDMTQLAYVAKEVWDMPLPGLWHHPYGFGTLGYGMPAAIGACVHTGGAVLAIAGDSGFQYTMQELGTAAELGLSLPILIWDNDALGEIRDNMIEAQIAPNAVTQVNPDWALLAQAYGCGYSEPETLDALGAAVNAGFEAGRPTLIRATPGISK